MLDFRSESGRFEEGAEEERSTQGKKSLPGTQRPWWAACPKPACLPHLILAS